MDVYRGYRHGKAGTVLPLRTVVLKYRSGTLL
nr:MAG TPA: hypothetical protein [Microviridae sp.]